MADGEALVEWLRDSLTSLSSIGATIAGFIATEEVIIALHADGAMNHR